jgi:peptidoglycan/xylan/chitin deacetylase (PgdA/CDA1 family)
MLHLYSKLPELSHWLFREFFFKADATKNHIYLTFDDGPHPQITPWILEQCRPYNAKCCFFLLGKNAERHPEIVSMIQEKGHAIGNHGYAHLNGWKTRTAAYLNDISKAEKSIQSALMRPPYGKIKPRQLQALSKKYKVVLWNILAGDYDVSITPNDVFHNITSQLQAGCIIVLHDSPKAWPNLQVVLPQLLEFIYTKTPFTCKALQPTDLK